MWEGTGAEGILLSLETFWDAWISGLHPFPSPRPPPRGLWQADFCETLCHEPLLILLFIWSMACICSEPAFGENAFWIKATTICLTPLKLLCFFWPQWDHELFSFPEDPSKHDSKDHGCVWGNERHRRHCACPWKFKFVLRETEGKQNKSTKVEHSVLLRKKKSTRDKCSEQRDKELCFKEVLKWPLESLIALYLETCKGEKSEIFYYIALIKGFLWQFFVKIS